MFSKLQGNQQRKVPVTRKKQAVLHLNKEKENNGGRNEEAINREGAGREWTHNKGQNKRFWLAKTKREKQKSPN